MITNTIASPEFNTLLARCTQAELPSEFEDAKKKLVAFIDAWGLGVKHNAVEEFKAVCKFQGLVAVRENEATKLLMEICDMDMDHVKAMARFNEIDVDLFESMKRVPDDLTPDFTIEGDAQLNELLNASVHMALYGGNMDTGIHWSDCLEGVLERLKPAEEEQEAEDNDGDVPIEELLDRVGIESRLGQIMRNHFQNIANCWYEFQGNERPFGWLFFMRDGFDADYGDYAALETDMRHEFKIPAWADSERTHNRLMRLTYVQLVTDLIERGAK